MRRTEVTATPIVTLGFGYVLVKALFDRRTAVEPGTFVLLHGTDAARQADSRATLEPTIDRDDRTMKVALYSASQIVASLVARQTEEWPSGCPANLRLTGIEVVDIEEAGLTIGPTIVENPVLVAACPPMPQEVVIREDSQAGGGGNACLGTRKCILFEQSKLGMSHEIRDSRPGL